MKKVAALVLALALLLASAALAEVEIIGGTAATASGDLAFGEALEIEKIGVFKPLSVTADDYAFSIAAYDRDPEEKFTTPAVSDWGNVARFKYEFNGGNHPWSEMYLIHGFALKASSGEYKLLDVRMSVLNKMITPMDLADMAQATVTFAGEYEFPLLQVRMETDDTLGNPNEWLVEATPVPMLVERNVHFIFEVPNIVAASTEDLVAAFTLHGEAYELVLR